MHSDTAPIIAITIGDPAGIGPEVVVKALAQNADLRGDTCRPLLVGPWVVAEAARQQFAESLALVKVTSVEELAAFAWDGEAVPVWDVQVPGVEKVSFGKAMAVGGSASVQAIEEAATLAMSYQVNALATAPINKESVHHAGYDEIGHQEVLARMTGVSEIATMLMAGQLRAVHLTTHVPFHRAAEYVTKERILAGIRLTDRSFKEWGLLAPRIAVAALNPHGGDGGLLGREEVDEITPAVQEAQSEGIHVEGPIPADSVFLRAASGDFDAALALYHDQGHIAVKMHDFHGSVSVNLGLPFVRTSVDHGTAYDIAGKGIAEASSMVVAIRTAAQLATGRGFVVETASAATRDA